MHCDRLDLSYTNAHMVTSHRIATHSNKWVTLFEYLHLNGRVIICEHVHLRTRKH